ncbi:MAG: MBL fold metallo-hydrolase [Spirochaetes bacterium]|nr:MBL fold metallo-hydrolase [Spirochaetota bacterium]
MTVTVLVENTAEGANAGLRSEHGLSLHVAHGGMAVLHDTGASGLFADNAAALGIDLARVDLAVLSHGHYDHGGGLERFFEVNDRAPVFLRLTADAPHYARSMFRRREVGIPRDVFERHGGRFRFIDADTEATGGVFLLTSIGRTHPWVRFNRTLGALQEGRTICDDLAHELAMTVKLPDGLAVFTGCGHQGVLNMVDAARARFPGVPIRAVIGGFHLGGVVGKNVLVEPDESVRGVGEGLLERGVRMTWTGHCTGERAGRILKDVMGDRVAFLRTGLVIEL